MLSLIVGVCKDEVAFGDVCLAAVDATNLETDDAADGSRLLGTELCS